MVVVIVIVGWWECVKHVCEPNGFAKIKPSTTEPRNHGTATTTTTATTLTTAPTTTTTTKHQPTQKATARAIPETTTTHALFYVNLPTA